MSKYQYQPHWVKGEIVKEGLRGSEDRYKEISKFCNTYNRPFSVLDLGANFGYFSLRLAAEFDCHVTMIEKAKGITPELQNLCVKNEANNVTLLKHNASIESLKALSKVEKFDVILAMSVIHYFEDANEAIKILRSMCDHLLIELPVSEDAAHPDVVKKIIVPDDAILLSRFRTHIDSVRPFYLMSSPRTEDIIEGWSGKYLGEFMKKESIFKMYSNFDEKYIIYTNRLKSRTEEIKSVKDKDGHPASVRLAKILKNELKNTRQGPTKFSYRDFIPGINLMTYFNMGGQYPTKQSILDDVSGYDEPHGDIRPWNIILTNDGAKIFDKKSQEFFNITKELDEYNLQKTIEWIENTKIQDDPIRPIDIRIENHYTTARKK